MARKNKKPLPPVFPKREINVGLVVTEIWADLKSRGWTTTTFTENVFDHSATTFKSIRNEKVNVTMTHLLSIEKALGYSSLFHFLKNEDFILLHKHNAPLYRALTKYARRSYERRLKDANDKISVLEAKLAKYETKK